MNKKPERLPEILTLSQIKELLQKSKDANHPWRYHWAMALLTGMRSGELYALEWESIDLDNRMIFVHKGWSSKEGFGPTKGRYWRTVPINQDLYTMLLEIKAVSQGRKNVLERFSKWTEGYQAEELRSFCLGLGIKSIKFHTLRACFATQLMRNGVAPGQVMKICGWKDLKTMMRYVRLAGIEEKGGTDTLQIMPEAVIADNVVDLYKR